MTCQELDNNPSDNIFDALPELSAPSKAALIDELKHYYTVHGQVQANFPDLKPEPQGLVWGGPGPEGPVQGRLGSKPSPLYIKLKYFI